MFKYPLQVDLFPIVMSNIFNTFSYRHKKDTHKACHSSDIPTKILKQNVKLFPLFILGYINKSISSFTFPLILQLAEIPPV